MAERTLAIVAVALLVAASVLAVVVLRHGDPPLEPLPEAGGPAMERPAAAAEPAALAPAPPAAAERGAGGGQPVAAASDGFEDVDSPPDPILAATGMHAALLRMPESGRNALLRLAVTDARFPCDTVNSASTPADLPLWRVSCAGAHFYMVTIDELQDFHVEPVQWDAPGPPPSLIERRTLEIVPAPAPDP